MSWRDAPLYVQAHDLTRWVLERAGSWKERGGEPLAGPVAEAVCELLGSLSLALTFPETRADHLQKADEALVRLRVLLRVARDLTLISPGGLRYAEGQLLAIGRMLGGWRKRTNDLSRRDERGAGAGRRVDSGDGLPVARTA